MGIKINFSHGEEPLEINAEKLTGYNFDKRNLHRAIFERMDITQCSFKECDLRGAIFIGARGVADFSQARAMTADFSEADLSKSTLTQLHATSADFTGSTLVGCNFSDALLNSANFSRTNLCSANFSGADISDANFKGALYDQYTRWPTDFEPSSQGLVYIRSKA